ncbi:MAG: leucine-rich repeat protein, partial [Candidatus Methanomethylophilaceae archaeon]|nr:leucine-rich repeat protein [Candidatus Methanomethylophilaceae archaeon]
MGANVLKATTAIAILIVAAAAFSSFQTSDAETATIDGIEYELKEGGGVRTAMVTAYSVTTMTGDVTIPSQVTHEGKTYTVTSLAKTLRNNMKITSVSLPETVVSIDSYFFSGCTSLKSVTMDGVLSIPLQCF